MPPCRRSVGETLAEKHREEGRNTFITEIFEALADWGKHKERCYCGACEVLKPAFAQWTRQAAEARGNEFQETLVARACGHSERMTS